MVTKWNHGLQNPEDGLVVSQEVFSQGYVLLTLPLLQETLDMLVKPGFIPSCDIVNLGFLEREHIFYIFFKYRENPNLLWCFDIRKVTDHDDGILLSVHRGLDIVGDLLVLIPRAADVPDHVAVFLLSPDRDVLHVDVGLDWDDL